MNNIERRDKGLAYISDEQVFNQQKRARILTQKLNTIDRSDYDGINKLVKQLFGKCENVFLNPPFYCDYGFNIEAGKNLFVNYNCTIIDVAKVKIGDNCFIAPNVQFIQPVIQFILLPAIPCMSMVSKLLLVIIVGLVAIALFALVFISEIMW